MIAQAEHIPVHLGAMPDAVAAAMALGLHPGTRSCILNDPYTGGTHLPDVTLVSRTVARLRRLARAPRRRRRHGAGEPARRSRASSYQEGLIIPPARLTDEVARRSSSRTRATRTSGAATCARSSPRTASPSGGSTSCARGAAASASRRRWTSCTRTPSGWCAPRSPRSRTAAGRPRTSSRRSTASCRSAAPSRSPATRSGSTSRARRRSTRATSTARSRSRARPATSSSAASPSRTCPRRAARSRRSR